MRVLIVENNQSLGEVWKQHLERQDAEVQLETCEETAMRFLTENPVDVIVLNLDLDQGGALTVADFAAYRRPDAKVIFVTASSFFLTGRSLPILQMPAPACRRRPNLKIWQPWLPTTAKRTPRRLNNPAHAWRISRRFSAFTLTRTRVRVAP